MKTKLIAAVAVSLVAAGFAGGFLLGTKPKAGPPPESPTFTVTSTAIEDTIEVSGHLKPFQEQELRAPSTGILISLPVTLNQVVNPGQVVGKLDTSEQDQAVADLKLQWDQETFLGNQRKADLVLGKIQVQEQAIENQTWRARFRGQVTRLTAKAGDSLKVGELYGKLADLDQLVADVEVPELDVLRIRSGQKVEFRFPALPGVVVTGTVSTAGVEGRTNDKGLTVFDTKLVIAAPPESLRPGFSFRALIVANAPRAVTVVESQAVFYTAGRAQVNRKTSTGFETVPVEVEGFGGGLVRVISGLAPGDVLLGAAL